MSKKNKKSNKGLITGLIVGGAITGVAGMLLSSEENRKKTKTASKKITHKGFKLIQNLLKK